MPKWSPTDEMMMAPTAIVPRHSLRKITCNLEKMNRYCMIPLLAPQQEP